MDQTLIIGLGNPDPALENTYHNAGAIAVQWLAEHSAAEAGLDTPAFRTHNGIFSYVKSGKRIFVRPLVFMNESGIAVREAMKVFSVNLNHVVVIHDDSDIPLGDFKCADGGGSAGHKGIKSIIEHVRAEAFARIRIGIREPNEPRRKKAGAFVLSPITARDKKILDDVFQKISGVVFLES